MKVDDLLQHLKSANVQAFLKMLRWCEGTAGPDGYKTLFGSSLFENNFADHPRKVIEAKLGTEVLKSTAAGAYQFLSKTWDGLVTKYNFPDFSPKYQDLGAVALIHGRGALEDVLNGSLDEAIKKCNKEWASLPGSPYGQPVKTLDQCRKVYTEAGGLFQAQGDAKGFEDTKPIPQHDPYAIPGEPAGYTSGNVPPVIPKIPEPKPYLEEKEEIKMPIPATFLWGLASTLINVFEPLAKEKVSKEVGRHTNSTEIADQVATAVIEAAKKVTGKSDPVDAISTAKTMPNAIQAAQEDAISTLNRLAPLMEKVAIWDREAYLDTEASRAAASARAAAEGDGEDSFLTRSIVWMFIGAILSLSVLAGILKYLGMNVETIIGALLTLIGVMSREFSTRYQYRYGSSRGSAAKDVVLAEVTRHRG